MSIDEFIAILAFMLVSTGLSIFIIKPITADELLIGQWFMVLGVMIWSIIFKLIIKIFEK